MAQVEQQRKLITSMETSEWYTPRNYLYKVRTLFGGEITLDPASCATANDIVKAKNYFTVKDDGLEQDWYGNVFVNPPYCDFDNPKKAVAPKWATKSVYEYLYGNSGVNGLVLLVNAKVGYKWFNSLLDLKHTVVVLHRNRLGFISAKQLINNLVETTEPSRQPQATIYMGPYKDSFLSLFSEYGWVIN